MKMNNFDGEINGFLFSDYCRLQNADGNGEEKQYYW